MNAAVVELTLDAERFKLLGEPCAVVFAALWQVKGIIAARKSNQVFDAAAAVFRGCFDELVIDGRHRATSSPEASAAPGNPRGQGLRNRLSNWRLTPATAIARTST